FAITAPAPPIVIPAAWSLIMPPEPPPLPPDFVASLSPFAPPAPDVLIVPEIVIMPPATRYTAPPPAPGAPGGSSPVPPRWPLHPARSRMGAGSGFGARPSTFDAAPSPPSPPFVMNVAPAPP